MNLSNPHLVLCHVFINGLPFWGNFQVHTKAILGKWDSNTQSEMLCLSISAQRHSLYTIVICTCHNNLCQSLFLSLQSSLNSEEGLGVASLSVLYAALILSSMFLPPILIKKLGCKWTIAISMCCYIAFSLGNFYASWYDLNTSTLSVVFKQNK